MEKAHLIARKTYSEKHVDMAGVYEFGYGRNDICI